MTEFCNFRCGRSTRRASGKSVWSSH